MISCSNCHLPYPEDGVPYRCPSCGGIFDYLDRFPLYSGKIERNLPGIWQYCHTFGLDPDGPMVYLGEGHTPLVWIIKREVDFGVTSLAVKLESLNPTGSHKDRGSAVLVSFLKSRSVQAACEDSSGNAGASFAAYCANAGIESQIYVPEGVSAAKRLQIEKAGGKVIQIPGSRSKTAEAIMRKVDHQPGIVYASHAYLPFGMAGYATIAYELIEQLGNAPGTVIAPVGHGSLLLGIGRGFESLLSAGVISHMPKLIGVQARACAPLWALTQFGAVSLAWSAEGETLAEGIRIQHPIRGDALLRLVEASKGTFIAVEEDEILVGRDQLARMGFYVELTSAVVWSALKYLEHDVPEPVVAVLTGSGIKNDL
jgi:threonine synthase